MRSKKSILNELQAALEDKVITEADVRSVLHQETPAGTTQDSERSAGRTSAVDVMFYIAGIVLFAALLSVITQSWNDLPRGFHVVLSAGLGAALWAVAYSLIRSAGQSDLRRGLTGALLLTGSLAVITGGVIITNEFIVDSRSHALWNFLYIALMLIVLGAAHIVYDRFVKRDLVLSVGVLLTVSAFPAVLFGFLSDADAPADLWSLALIAGAVLLAYATRVAGKLQPHRVSIRGAFDWLAAFVVLLTMFISSFWDNDILWTVLLIVSVLGLFYLSIVSQKKHLLGTASFFLVVTIITVSFRYFSDYGVTTSLIISAIGLLGTAAMAANINKRYFK